jgi:hypothetical protein
MFKRLACSVLQFLQRYSKPIWLCILAVLALAIAPIVIAKIYQRLDNDPDRGAIAIAGGAFGESYSTPRYLEQGWTSADSLWFYNTTQGSALLPYDFFLVLKQANSDELFRSDKNIDRFRYLPQKKTLFNPDALPVGFVKETYEGRDYVGYTCAACHTGQVNYKGQALRIDGGPAMADMVGFLTELQNAMKAAQSGDKQKNFVDDVLKLKNGYSSATAVSDDLEKWRNTLNLYNAVNHSDVEYGHARLDAFGRIFNRVVQHAISYDQVTKELALVIGADGKPLLKEAQIKMVMDGLGSRIVLSDDDFATIVQRLKSKAPYPDLPTEDLYRVRDKIFNPPTAPVSYPFLWDIAHSDYVQWNGLANNSAAGPLGRNAGEVIGVFGILDWGTDNSLYGRLKAGFEKFSLAAYLSGQHDKREIIEFKSSINLFNLQRLESGLRDLKSPEWPFCKKGKDEYYLPADANNPISPSKDENYCGTDTRFDKDSRQRGELLYIERCQSCHTVVDRSAWDRIVVGNMVSLENARTDPAMATHSVNYKGKSGNFKDTYQAVGIGDMVVQEDAPVVQILTAATKGVLGTPDSDKWLPRRMVDYVYTLVASIGDNSIKKSSIKNGDYDPDTTSKPYNSLLAYRARSLNGIWATAPYLHNGSVPTLWDLLLPADQRPRSFKVGAREFDPVKVGFKSDGYDGFTFDTSQPGNHNTGHDDYGKPLLTDQNRWDLIEYLKSL